MRILEVCPYSAGICGVWSRVFTEAKALKEMGHEVIVFSSNATKGSKEIAPSEEVIDGIKINRIKYRKLGGESFMNWSTQWIKDAEALNPDIIIAHNYRHLHTTDAIEIKKNMGLKGKSCKVILVTHAPFVKDNKTRGFLSALAVGFYDRFIAPSTLYNFDAVVRICNWEEPELIKLGIPKEKIYYIPNIVPSLYFEIPIVNHVNKTVLFLGRVAPIKNIEFIYELAKIMPDYNFSIVGPIEESYMKTLSDKYPEMPKNITYYDAVYDPIKKINIYDLHKYFILPSIREAMPQSLMEAMARGRIVISTNTDGAREIISNGENGLVLQDNTPEEAKAMILGNEFLPLDSDKIRDEIKQYYSMDTLKRKYQNLFERIMK